MTGWEISQTRAKQCQSQHTGPTNQSQHIPYFVRRGCIENDEFNQTGGERGAVIFLKIMIFFEKLSITYSNTPLKPNQDFLKGRNRAPLK